MPYYTILYHTILDYKLYHIRSYPGLGRRDAGAVLADGDLELQLFPLEVLAAAYLFVLGLC